MVRVTVAGAVSVTVAAVIGESATVTAGASATARGAASLGRVSVSMGDVRVGRVVEARAGGASYSHAAIGPRARARSS